MSTQGKYGTSSVGSRDPSTIRIQSSRSSVSESDKMKSIGRYIICANAERKLTEVPRASSIHHLNEALKGSRDHCAKN